MVSYVQYRNFKTPLPRVASTWRLEVTYTSFVRKVRRHFLYKHLSEHPVIILYCSVPYVGRSYARHLQLLTSGTGNHAELGGWKDRAPQREPTDASLLSWDPVNGVRTLGNNGTGRNGRAVAVAVGSLYSSVEFIFILFPVATKSLCAPEQKIFVKYLAGVFVQK